MSTFSRSYILSRRGTGIANLQTTNIEAGDFDLDRAEETGLYKINCTHQVGIATSTEIGLTADRFPVRVILTMNSASIPGERTDAVCSYWMLTNAAGAPVPYSRRPLASDQAVKSLYSMYPDFDNMLWSTFESIRGVAYSTDLEENMTRMSDELSVILRLQNPTTEQRAIASTHVANILASAVANNRVPYFRLTDDIYLRGEPHGRLHASVGNMSASRVALVESALCILINYGRLRAKYDTLSDGAITMAAYSIAGMFRFGLHESYEHKEYYTVFMSPVENRPGFYKVDSVRSPVAAEPPADIRAATEFDLTRIRLLAQMVEISNLLVVSSGLMHYLFNHTTGGTTIQGTLLTILSMYQIITSDMPQETQIAITSLFYEALHPSNKRGIANIFFKTSNVTTHGRCATSPRFERFSLDSFTAIRANPYPAGSHKAFICLTALRRVLQAGLGPFLPWAEQMNACITLCRDVLSNGARSHIGSAYYTGEPPVAQPASIDNYLPELAQYVHTFNKGDSLAMSPHLSDEVGKRSNMNWQNLMKDLRAKDVSATSAEVVRSFLATAGSVHFSFDPADQSTWGRAVNDSNVAMNAINQIFN